MASNLPTLPDVNFVEIDPQNIIDEIIAGYEIAADRTLAEGDPVRLYLMSLAYIIIQQNQKINAAGKSNLLYYAKDDFLDHLGAFRQTERGEASNAVTTERFELSEVRDSNVGIPQGTRVTSNNQIYWQTTEPAVIVTGQTFVDVPIEAMTAGEAANGIEAGAINRLVDPVPYVSSVYNTEVTTGGADQESNEDYREKIYEAPTGFSTAGPRDAYSFWAKSTNQAIIDVAPVRPQPGYVDVYPLMEGGTLPNQAVLDAIETTLNDKKIRPLTDFVTAKTPNVQNFDIDIDYYISTDNAASVSIIQPKVDQAVQDYIEWQKTKLGRDVNPDQLIFLMKQAGAKRITIRSPVLTAVLETDVAVANNVTVNYSGLEDE